MKNFLIERNIGLATARSNKSEHCDHFYISDCIMEAKCAERTTQSALFPLFVFEQTEGGTRCRPNFDPEITRKICNSIHLRFAPKRAFKDEQCFTPMDLFDYIYAVLHSPSYREIYKEFLKIDFPRVPYPTDQELFWKLILFGGELRQLHLLESMVFDDIDAERPVEVREPVEKPAYCQGNVFFNKRECFNDVPEVAWEFFIGGYQPAQKWLKDRKGCVLSSEDIKHYKKIIRALSETDRIMKEIDEVIEEHGGW